MCEHFKFSEKEMSFLQDQEFLLSKNEIGEKIELLLGEVEKELHAVIPEYSFPGNVLVRSGKISKGDNYQRLPYYVLDFPRRFGKEGVFAFRTMFWWGNFFSATLHLSGQYLDTRRNALISNSREIISSTAFICTHTSPWEYHFNEDNFLKANKLQQTSLETLFATKPFVKISYRWDLGQYANLSQLVLNSFNQAMAWGTE